MAHYTFEYDDEKSYTESLIEAFDLNDESDLEDQKDHNYKDLNNNNNHSTDIGTCFDFFSIDDYLTYETDEEAEKNALYQMRMHLREKLEKNDIKGMDDVRYNIRPGEIEYCKKNNIPINPNLIGATPKPSSKKSGKGRGRGRGILEQNKSQNPIESFNSLLKIDEKNEIIYKENEIRKQDEIYMQNEIQKQLEIQNQNEIQKQLEFQNQSELQKQSGIQKQSEIQKQLEIQQHLEIEQQTMIESQSEIEKQQGSEIQKQNEIIKQSVIDEQSTFDIQSHVSVYSRALTEQEMFEDAESDVEDQDDSHRKVQNTKSLGSVTDCKIKSENNKIPISRIDNTEENRMANEFDKLNNGFTTKRVLQRKDGFYIKNNLNLNENKCSDLSDPRQDFEKIRSKTSITAENSKKTLTDNNSTQNNPNSTQNLNDTINLEEKPSSENVLKTLVSLRSLTELSSVTGSAGSFNTYSDENSNSAQEKISNGKTKNEKKELSQEKNKPEYYFYDLTMNSINNVPINNNNSNVLQNPGQIPSQQQQLTASQQNQLNRSKTPTLNPQIHHLSSQQQPGNSQQAPSPLNSFKAHIQQKNPYYLPQNGSYPPPPQLNNQNNNVNRSNSPNAHLQEVGPNFNETLYAFNTNQLQHNPYRIQYQPLMPYQPSMPYQPQMSYQPQMLYQPQTQYQQSPYQQPPYE